ncbi:uncharacterized protein LACBIDRAFT_299578 [Laccaria bicolor S238N-H82]|uniref:Predicted protein n=1 Tax=Laccaria bicolor (strain S238N-H82 / ATCC MYA-4686) TaxID=486041 RepID=B0DEW7_LACBS|nr:uncharacterized protein LACBIDRAFT_299578 [Laccaria bicolor S238N-H82]EDR06618.1 predicted protein [Laccaria bicolor S238N-H82]|eukprot:XP_001882465.1 predicted protein [Laccaria bicolor S238N-H82]
MPEVQDKINIETRRSTTPGKRVILVQGPWDINICKYKNGAKMVLHFVGLAGLGHSHSLLSLH